MKRLLVFLSVFIILISSLTVFSSASMDDVVVPIPWQKPSGPTVTLIYQNNSTRAFTVREFEIVLPEHYLTANYQVFAEVTSSYIHIYASVSSAGSDGVDIVLVRRQYSTSNSSYDLSITNFQNIKTSRYRLISTSIPSGSSTVVCIDSSNCPLSFENTISPSASYSYQGQVSTMFESYVISALSGLSSDNSVVISLLNGLNSKLQTSNGKFDNMIAIMEGDPIPPFEPPTNADVSDFEDAESAIYDSALSDIEDFTLEAFDPSSGSLGSAFQWLKENLEFYTSNPSFRTAILVILSLSVVSVLLKIYV